MLELEMDSGLMTPFRLLWSPLSHWVPATPVGFWPAKAVPAERALYLALTSGLVCWQLLRFILCFSLSSPPPPFLWKSGTQRASSVLAVGLLQWGVRERGRARGPPDGASNAWAGDGRTLTQWQVLGYKGTFLVRLSGFLKLRPVIESYWVDWRSFWVYVYFTLFIRLFLGCVKEFLLGTVDAKMMCAVKGNLPLWFLEEKSDSSAEVWYVVKLPKVLRLGRHKNYRPGICSLMKENMAST